MVGTVNVLVVIGGSVNLNGELSRRFAEEKTSLGEPIQLVQLDKSDGAARRDPAFTQRIREAAIKEYFFGDARRTLSPQIQQVEFGSVSIYKLSDCMKTASPFSLAFLLTTLFLFLLTWWGNSHEQILDTRDNMSSSGRSLPR